MFLEFNRRWTLGLSLLAVVIVLWVLSSFLIGLLFENDTYRKPFFITYFNTAVFLLYLLPTINSIGKSYIRHGNWNIEELIGEQEGERIVVDEGSQNALIPKNNEDASSPKLSFVETIELSAEFCILWFLANFVTNASLMYTSVASQTILSSTSSFFTLFVGSFYKVESINRDKIIGSLVSFLGIMLVTSSDSKHAFQLNMQNSEGLKTLLGNLLALSGALFYGIYSTFLKRRIRNENRINMTLFFGFVGLFTLVLLWPVMVFLHYMGWEKFELPKTPMVIAIVLFNCLITFVSDYCWASAMLLTSPLTVTIGLSITIPLAMMGDFIFKHKSVTFLYFIGAMLILGSFLIINRQSEEEFLQREQERGHNNDDGTI